MYLDVVKGIFRETSGIPTTDMIPCSFGDIRFLEELWGMRLPDAYQEWLLWMGRGAGPFLIGTDVYFDRLPGIKEGAQELFEENGLDVSLLDDTIVFYLHQGYVVQFLRSSDGDNPAVYGFAENGRMTVPEIWHSTLSDWLASELDDYLKSIQSR